MKLSRDKINDMHKIIVTLRKTLELRMRKDLNAVRFEIVRDITEALTPRRKWTAFPASCTKRLGAIERWPGAPRPAPIPARI